MHSRTQLAEPPSTPFKAATAPLRCALREDAKLYDEGQLRSLANTSSRPHASSCKSGLGTVAQRAATKMMAITR